MTRAERPRAVVLGGENVVESAVSHRTAALLLAWVTGAAACATTRPAALPRHVAVMPLKAVGVEPNLARDLRGAIVESVARSTSAEVDPPARVDRASSGREACATPGPDRQDACAVSTGAALGASHVVAGAVGGLGKTHVVQLRVLHVGQVAPLRSLEETFTGDFSTVLAAAQPMVEKLFEVPPPRPWYTRWWLWTSVGVAVTAAVVVPVVLTRRDEPYEVLPLP